MPGGGVGGGGGAAQPGHVSAHAAAELAARTSYGRILAYLVAMMPTNGVYYYLEIMLPGAVLGLIVGYATQEYGRGK